MKVMAIDLGDHRTGAAFSDLTGFIAGRAVTVSEWNRDALLEKLLALIEEEKPGKIVMGLPVNMNGTEGPRAGTCREFAARLSEACGMQVELWDERATSVSAGRILRESGTKGKKARAKVDAIAASIILQSWLDAHR